MPAGPPSLGRRSESILWPGWYFDLSNIEGRGCWLACFWWMHRISSRQNAVLEQLRKQGYRIENISKEEHDILCELHPNVEAIQEGVDEVSEKVERVEEANRGRDPAVRP